MIYICYTLLVLGMWYLAVVHPYLFVTGIRLIIAHITLIPLILLMVFKKNHIKKYLCIALCFSIIAIWFPIMHSNHVMECRSKAYLSADSPFHTAARTIMPELDSFHESFHVSYFYREDLLSEVIAIKIHTEPHQFKSFAENIYAKYTFYPHGEIDTVWSSSFENPFAVEEYLFYAIYPDYDELNKWIDYSEAAVGYSKDKSEIIIIFLCDDTISSYGLDYAVKNALIDPDWIMYKAAG